MDINQVLNSVCWSKAKKGRTPFLNANNLPRKDPAVEINGFEGVGPEWLMPKRNPCYVLEESRIWRGREGNRPTDACPLYYLSFFLNFLSSFLCFLSYLFLFFLLFSFTLFFFYSVNTLCFSFPHSGHGKGPFIVPAVASFFTTLPLNRLCLVWAYLPTTKSVWHSPLPDKGRLQVCFIPQSTVALLLATT